MSLKNYTLIRMYVSVRGTRTHTLSLACLRVSLPACQPGCCSRFWNELFHLFTISGRLCMFVHVCLKGWHGNNSFFFFGFTFPPAALNETSFSVSLSTNKGEERQTQRHQLHAHIIRLSGKKQKEKKMEKWIEKWKQRRNNTFIHSVQPFEIKSQLVRQTYTLRTCN